MPSPSTTDPLLLKVLKSAFFGKAKGKASTYTRDPLNLYKLIKDVLNKSNSIKGEGIAGVRDRITLLTRLVKAYASGQYKVIPMKTLTRIVAVLIYFMSPIDFIPDFIPILGFTDDVALILWLFNAIEDDLEAFRQWDKAQNTVSIDH